MAGELPVFPLDLLPIPARQEIANCFDGYQNGFYLLAHHLGFQDVGLANSFWNRGFISPVNSGTLKLLEEYQHKGGTVQGLYRALYRMNHQAVDIIKEWLPDIKRAYQERLSTSRTSRANRENTDLERTGQQNSCPCQSCYGRQHSGQSSQSTQPPPYSERYSRQTSGQHWQPPTTGHSDTTREDGAQTSRSPRIQTDFSLQHSQHTSIPEYENVSVNPSQTQTRRPSDNPSNNLPEYTRAQQRGAPRGCGCEKCRLQSDPNETQLLTYCQPDSEHECLLSAMDSVRLSSEHGHMSEGGDSITRQVETNGARSKTIKVCANSKDGVHGIGERVDSCSVCHSVKELRHSWPPRNSDSSCARPLTDSSSDGSINVQEHPVETIYNRLSDLHSVSCIIDENNLNRYENIPTSQSDNRSWPQHVSSQSERFNDAATCSSLRQVQSDPGNQTSFVNQNSGYGNTRNDNRYANPPSYSNNISESPTNNSQNGHGSPTNNSQNGHGSPTNNNQIGHGSPTNNSQNGHGSPTNNIQNGHGSSTDNNQNGHGSLTNNNQDLNGNITYGQQQRVTLPPQTDHRPIVFLTYSPHSNSHLREIKTLIQKLQEANIRVKIDMNPDCFDEMRLNRNEWLDRTVHNATYIIICISPTYHADVQEPANINGPTPRISQLNAKYIFDRLRTEYIFNQAQNLRMIPVLFPNSGAEYLAHVPWMMQPTLVYSFPNKVRDIIGRILGNRTNLPYV